MRVLLSSGLFEMERAVAEMQDVRGLLSPAGLASGSPGEVVMLILPFARYGSELMETSNGKKGGKKEKYRNEKSMVERRCKHAKRHDLLVEQEVRGEACVCKLLCSLPWPARPLQVKGACCSMLDATKTFQSFFLLGKMRETYVCPCEMCLGHCAWLGEAHLHPPAAPGCRPRASTTGLLLPCRFKEYFIRLNIQLFL